MTWDCQRRRSSGFVMSWGVPVAELGEDLQAAAGQLQPALDGLIRVGDAAEADRLRLPARRRQLAAEQLRRLLLDEDARLEVEAGGQAEVFVRRPSVAIN